MIHAKSPPTFLYLPFFNPIPFHVFCAHPFFGILFPAFFYAHMLTGCSDETSSLLFLRSSDRYDDNLEDNSVFQSLLKFLMLWAAEESGILKYGVGDFLFGLQNMRLNILSRVTNSFIIVLVLCCQ